MRKLHIFAFAYALVINSPECVSAYILHAYNIKTPIILHIMGILCTIKVEFKGSKQHVVRNSSEESF